MLWSLATRESAWALMRSTMSCGSLNLAMIGPKGEKHSIDGLSVATEQEVLSASYLRSRRVVFSIACRCLSKVSDQCNTRPYTLVELLGGSLLAALRRILRERPRSPRAAFRINSLPLPEAIINDNYASTRLHQTSCGFTLLHFCRRF